VIPVGCNNITNDIAAGLRTPMADADRLKRLSGCALGRMVADEEEIEVPGVGGHPPRRAARRVLSDIVEPRVGIARWDTTIPSTRLASVAQAIRLEALLAF
jgi:cell division protein FtsA